MRIFLVCPVRNVSKKENAKIRAYVRNLEKQGHKVYWPYRDNPHQQTDTIGTVIINNNHFEMKHSDEVHIWWNPNSTGSIWDVCMAWMLGKCLFLVNRNEVKPTPFKSFTNVVLDMTRKP